MARVQTRYDPAIEDLLKQLSEERNAEIFVSTFPRYGLSGAQLFLIYFENRDSLPFLFKVSPIGKAQEEYEAVTKLENFVRDCRLEIHGVIKANGWGGLLYPHVGTDEAREAENPVTLHKVSFCEEHECPRDNLAKHIVEVYQRLQGAHRQLNWRSARVDTLYDRYYRSNKSESRIQQILRAGLEKPDLDFLGTKIYNPLLLFQQRPREGKFAVGCVHGDLHPDNIILAKGTEPHLIDFAWAHQSRDILVDFVLFENSLRFRHFPRPANLDDQLRVDELFLKTDSIDEIAKLQFASEKAENEYVRLSVLVSSIRREARTLLEKHFTDERYLFAQFLVLYGLLAYDQYEPYTSTRALGMIARCLHETGWDFLR
jgi:Ternary complex associated domain 9